MKTNLLLFSVKSKNLLESMNMIHFAIHFSSLSALFRLGKAEMDSKYTFLGYHRNLLCVKVKFMDIYG